MQEWRGPFYREKRRMFSSYAELFNSAEINSTFYRYPDPGMIKGLYRHSPPGFIFAAKMPRQITHEKRLSLRLEVEEDLHRFLDLMGPLAEKLGPILIQLPPSFTYQRDGGAAERFLEALPSGFEFAVEFRQLSWMRPETWEMLTRHGVAYTIVDEPLLPQRPVSQRTSSTSDGTSTAPPHGTATTTPPRSSGAGFPGSRRSQARRGGSTATSTTTSDGR